MVSVVAVNVVALGSIGFGWRAPESRMVVVAFAGLLLGLAHYLMTDVFVTEATLVAPFVSVLWALSLDLSPLGNCPSSRRSFGCG